MQLSDLFNQFAVDGSFIQAVNLIDVFGLSDDDIDIQVLAFILGCKTRGLISREEWNRIPCLLSCTTLNELKTVIKEKCQGILSLDRHNTTFASFYHFVFEWQYETLGIHSKLKVIPLDDALALWRVLFKATEWPLIPQFLDYMANQYCCSVNDELPEETGTTLKLEKPLFPYSRAVTRDVWYTLLFFAKKYQTLESVKTYDEGAAWPIAYDEFYRWLVKSKIL